MKRNLKFVILTAIFVFALVCFAPIRNVNAAYAYQWTVNGETLIRGSSNKAGNVSWLEDASYDGGILTLNNYNGGQLKIHCYGTGLGHVFAVKLVGENKITVDKGVGIVADAPVIFIGDGNLTIEAAVPIGTEFSEAEKHIANTTILIESKANAIKCEPCAKIETSNEVSETVNETTKEDNNEVAEDKTEEAVDEVTNDKTNTTGEVEKNETVEEKNYTLFNSLILGICLVLLITVVVLALKLKKKN